MAGESWALFCARAPTATAGTEDQLQLASVIAQHGNAIAVQGKITTFVGQFWDGEVWYSRTAGVNFLSCQKVFMYLVRLRLARKRTLRWHLR